MYRMGKRLIAKVNRKPKPLGIEIGEGFMDSEAMK
jgi:hypothetical protein